VTTVVAGAACAGRSTATSVPAEASAVDTIGQFVWQDLVTDDLEASRAFYSELLGWEFERVTRLGDPYLLARSDFGYIGGITFVEREDPDEPIAQWLSYLSVADVDQTAADLTASGGRVLVEPIDLENGRAAVGVDPQGALVGFVQVGANAVVPVSGQSAPAGMFFWRDYLAADAEDARDFYTALIGLTADQQARPDLLLHYALRRPGPEAVAGIVPIGSEQVNPNWLPYVRVDDPAGLAARAQALGGGVLLAPRADVRNGSVAIVTDPGGAAVALQRWPF